MRSQFLSAGLLAWFSSFSLLVVAVLVPAETRGSEKWGQPLDPRVACGPNAAYLFLRVYGQDVSFDELESSLVVSGNPGRSRPGAMTLLDLKRTLEKFSFFTSIRQCSADEFVQNFQRPVLAYLRFGDLATADLGHFVVITGVADGTVSFLDGSSGHLEKYSMSSFAQRWSGFMLEPGLSEDSMTWFRITWLFSAVLILLLLTAVLRPVNPKGT